VHNPILEYASTTSISTVMTTPLHLKRKFLKKWFFSWNIITPQVLQRWSIKKEEREKLLKKERKRGRKRKTPRVSLNKGEVNILRGEKTLQLQKYPFWCDSIFSPSIILFQNPFQNYWESFISSFWTII
jgi:hypothetical protein